MRFSMLRKIVTASSSSWRAPSASPKCSRTSDSVDSDAAMSIGEPRLRRNARHACSICCASP
jgi:hypothetical protein